MTNLRERKKRESKQKILEFAKDIFLTKGYTNTSITEIAKKSDVGVGTIYNYFKSKADLFLHVFMEDNKGIKQKFSSILTKRFLNPIEGIMELIIVSTEIFTYIPKDFWKEIFGVIMGNFEESKMLFNGFLNMDMEFVEQLIELMQVLQRQQQLSSDLDIQNAAQIIYSIVIVQFMFYIYQEQLTFDEIINNIRNQITLIIQ